MIDQEQQTSETQTATEQTSESPAQRSSTSTTENQSGVDLAADEGGEEQQTQTQSEDTRTDEEKAAEAAREELFGAPADGETYKIEGLPEGMEIDKEALDAVTPAFRELGLSDKGASKVAAVYAEKVLPKVMEQATKSIETQVIAQRTQWETDAEAAIKANGSDLKNKAGEVLAFDAKPKEAVLQTAAKALDRLAPQGFREFLKDTGLAQHPFMVAFAYQAGKLLAEDTDLEAHESGAHKPKSRVEKYYPAKSGS